MWGGKLQHLKVHGKQRPKDPLSHKATAHSKGWRPHNDT